MGRGCEEGMWEGGCMEGVWNREKGRYSFFVEIPTLTLTLDLASHTFNNFHSILSTALTSIHVYSTQHNYSSFLLPIKELFISTIAERK